MPQKLKSIFIIIAIIFLVAGCKTDQEKKISLMANGEQYFSATEYKKAEIEFRNALQLSPDDPQVWSLLGNTLMKLGKPREAFQAYAKVEAYDPDNKDALVKLAGFFVLGKQPDKAKEKIERVLELDPDNIEALFLKAQILTQEKNFDMASTLLERIIDLKPDHIAAIQALARIKIFKQEFPQAEKLLNRAVEVAPADIQPRLTLASFLVFRKRLKDAEVQLLTGIEKNPENSDVRIILGNFYFRIKNNASAEAAYLKAVELAPKTIKPYIAAAGFYEITNNRDKALEIYQKALAVQPENIVVESALARFHYINKDINAAEALVKEMLEKRPKFRQARMLKSELLISKNRFDDALRILQDLEKDDIKDSRVRYFQGLCHIGLGQNEMAKAAVTKAVELSPGYLKARLLLADIYLHERSFDLAQNEATEVLKMDPSNYRATMISASSHMNVGKTQEAENGFKTLIKLNPENPSGYYQMGLLESTLRRYEEANKFLKQAMSKDNTLLDVFTLLIRNYANLNQLDMAHELCKKQIEIAKNEPSVIAIINYLEGNLYLAYNEINKAKDSFNKAIEANPDYLLPYSAIAQIALALNNKENAITQYQIMLEKNPNLPVTHMKLGILYEMGKEFNKAADHYRKALEINPEYAPAANNLAYHLAKRTDKFDEALALARTAKDKTPNDPGVMDTLGYVYYKKGLYGNAASEFLDSLEKIPDSPVVHYHLGLTYHKKGENKLAIKQFEQALKLNIVFEDADKAKMLLQELKDEALNLY